MPLSIWLGMEDCLEAITRRQPASVLDAGIGFGLWGHLLRQYLDVWSGRIQPEQWRVRIDGIEIDAARVQPHARHLYDHIYIGDIREIVPDCALAGRYDVILFGDILEHLPKADAAALLQCATQRAGKLVVLRQPLGNGWRRQGREPADHHRSLWSLNDFSGYAATIRQYDFFGNPYALVTIDTAPGPQAASWQRVTQIDLRLDRLEWRLQDLLAGRPSDTGKTSC